MQQSDGFAIAINPFRTSDYRMSTNRGGGQVAAELRLGVMGAHISAHQYQYTSTSCRLVWYLGKYDY